MSSGSPPPRPQPVSPPEEWPHYHLYLRVKKAIAALPIHFATDTHIEGISATDIFTLNTALGATIEEQVVATLNRIRTTWDPDGGYALYRFDRQPQTFPDVVLRRLSHDPAEDREIIMGIELKGWYLLSKEGEPSFRYRITGAACADADLLVVVPWVLKNVVSGQPRVLDPYVRPAKYAAEARNHYWQYGRTTSHSTEVIHPEGPVSPTSDQTERGTIPAATSGGMPARARWTTTRIGCSGSRSAGSPHEPGWISSSSLPNPPRTRMWPRESPGSGLACRSRHLRRNRAPATCTCRSSMSSNAPCR